MSGTAPAVRFSPDDYNRVEVRHIIEAIEEESIITEEDKEYLKNLMIDRMEANDQKFWYAETALIIRGYYFLIEIIINKALQDKNRRQIHWSECDLVIKRAEDIIYWHYHDEGVKPSWEYALNEALEELKDEGFNPETCEMEAE